MSKEQKKQIFNPVPTPFNFSESEKDIIRFWKENDIYHKSLKQREGCPPFVFYEGPPTANGMPHPGHCLTRTIKDIFPRYKTMTGYYCERKAGWDTHGLPVEIEVCKELGIIEGGKEAIEKYGVEKFNHTCIESVFRYQQEWEELTSRIGFWVDLEDAYVTYHQSYVESVWWALKQLFNKGLLYQGHKVVWWWAQGGTALSAGEVGEGYRETVDPAITVRLPLTVSSKKTLGITEETQASLLIWTTTPWTLPSNCAAAVGPDIEYAIVQTDGEKPEIFILAKSLLGKYFEENVNILQEIKGCDLIGLTYEPLFHYDTPRQIEKNEPAEKYWQVVPGDFVDLETGTGIVHLAPAFGEDDYRVCKELGIGFLCFVKPDGTFDERVTDVDPYDQTPFAGRFCKDADKGIIRLLKERGKIFKHDQYRHAYPFCPRSDKDPLIQYARKSWFIRTSQFRDKFLENNKKIRWYPEHIRDGRFGNFLANNVDWAISRERYWGTPLPIWVCEKTGYMEAVGSYEELLAKPDVQGIEIWEEAKAKKPDISEHLKIHKPYIDAIHYQSPRDPESRMRRVPEVIDVWFDAGSMPFAQWGYPHIKGSDEKFLKRFPADFISEAIDQTRGWFNALLVISTIIHEENIKPYPHPFKNCICLGHIMGEDGLKLSKRLKNYEEPSLLFEKFSADALRWSFIAKNPPTSTGRLSEHNVEEAQRELLIRWFNVYSFFTIYANLDGFDPSTAPSSFLTSIGIESESSGNAGSSSYRPWADRDELDRWILHELGRTILLVRESMENYDCHPAARYIQNFVESLSNWYVRRSRERFWAGTWSQNKADAYWTLYECLLKLSQLAAPFVPFFSETTWRNLAAPLPAAPISVHLCRYPEMQEKDIDYELLEAMAATREAVTLGLNARRTANIKVRQPLGHCELILSNNSLRPALEKHRELILNELNVKNIAFTDNAEQYVTFQLKPNFKVLGPRLGKKVKVLGKILSQGDPAKLCAQLNENNLSLEIEGESFTFTQEDIEVRLIPKEGFTAAQGRLMVVVLSTEITEELRQEGWVRELIRHIQDARKEAGLPYDARINLLIGTTHDVLRQVIEKYEAKVSGEVLATGIELKPDIAEDDKKILIDKMEIGIQIIPS